MSPKHALVRHPKDRLPPGRDFSELFQRCEDIVLCLGFTILLIRNTPLTLAHPISWRPPDEGITLVALFGAIEIRLAAMLKVGLTVCEYVYVDNNQVSTCVACHHFHHFMVLYPQHLDPTTIRGCFVCYLYDATLTSEVDLRRLDHVDLVIVEWPC